MKWWYSCLLLLSLLYSAPQVVLAATAGRHYHIGILAFKPLPDIDNEWQAAENYLRHAIPEFSFSVDYLTAEGMEAAIQNRQIDFVLTNPQHYIYLLDLYNLTPPLVSIERTVAGQLLRAFGGCILTRADQQQITSLADLKNRRVAVSFRQSMGGYLAQQYELYLHKFPLIKDDQLIITGLPHDNVVRAVARDQADVGFVRAGTLERMALSGEIDPKNFRILNPQPFASVPFTASTHLYPEWPLAAMAHVDLETQRQVTAVLLKMHDFARITQRSEISGFTPPANYLPIDSLMRSLRVAPFDQVPRIKLNDLWQEYRLQLIVLLLCLIAICLLSFYLLLSRKQARQSEEKFRSYFMEDSSIKLITEPGDGSILAANYKALGFYGYDKIELLAKKVSDIDNSSKENLQQIFDLIYKENKRKFVTRHRMANGQVRDVEVTVSPLNFYGKEVTISTVIDITDKLQAERERDKLEMQLHQKQKLEALGNMAGGIAHNFNNYMSIILGNLEICEEDPKLSPDLETNIINAKTAVLRSRELVHKILTFSKSSPVSLVPINLAEVLVETATLLQASLPETVKFDQRIDSSNQQLTIAGDAVQIQESLLNLYNNAIHAMNDQGKLQIVLERIDLTPKEIPAQFDCLPGAYARISIEDTGSGMSKEVMQQIFDPFFTTKGLVKGTGMGLSTVKGIIQQHKGLILVSSEPGQGSVFELYLPLIDPPLNISGLPDKQKLPRGNERILFIDDEQLIIAVGSQMFALLGYQVTAETSAERAFQLFVSDPWQFDLVLSDLAMPEMTGLEFIAAIKKIRPDIPALICSGFRDNLSPAAQDAAAIDAFCQKPLQLAELAKIIRNVLDSRTLS